MTVVFELVKVLFFLCVMAVAVLQLKGAELLDTDYVQQLIEVIFPSVFVLAGVMIGWIIAVYFANTMQPSQQLLIKGFIVGLLLGSSAAILYALSLTGGF